MVSARASITRLQPRNGVCLASPGVLDCNGLAQSSPPPPPPPPLPSIFGHATSRDLFGVGEHLYDCLVDHPADAASSQPPQGQVPEVASPNNPTGINSTWTLQKLTSMVLDNVDRHACNPQRMQRPPCCSLRHAFPICKSVGFLKRF